GADLGQAHLAGGAVQELGADLPLEAGDLLAHRGPRVPEGPGRPRETALFDHARENDHLLQVVHALIVNDVEPTAQALSSTDRFFLSRATFRAHPRGARVCSDLAQPALRLVAQVLAALALAQRERQIGSLECDARSADARARFGRELLRAHQGRLD